VSETFVLLRNEAHAGAHELARTEPFNAAGTQVFGRRVLIAHLSDEQSSSAERIDAVLGVFTDAVPANLIPDDDLGRIATEAWNSRHATPGDKSRVGDGMAWDHEHFEHEGHPRPARD
jgi:hypothetical protein